MGWGAVVGAFATIVVPHVACGAAGDLDPSFGVGGIVVTAAGPDYEYLHGVAVQPDGAIVAVGTVLGDTNLDFAVVRYAPNGMLDLGFGIGGIARIDFGTPSDIAAAVLLQPDGKIVAVGRAYYSIALARLLPDGRLDASFGGHGIVTTPLSLPNGAWDASLQPDGKIVAVAGGGGTYMLFRYDTYGALDPTFGDDGRASATLSFGFGDPFALTRQADGKLVVAGTATVGDQLEIAVARFDSDGRLDASFGSGGFVTTGIASVSDQSDSARDVVLQPDGKIVVAGSTCGFDCDVAVARYESNGTLDPTFGNDGTVVTDVGGDSDFASAIELQADGKILVVGSAWGPTYYDIVVVRYRSDGSLDPTFGGDGKVTTAIGPSTNFGNAVALQPDGRAVVAGYMYSGTTYDFALARYLADPVCGNGQLESGEDCDDGNEQDGDCCSGACRLEPNGSACPDDGQVCTADICDGAGTCRHPAGNTGAVCRPGAGPCDAAEGCDGQGTACPPNVVRPVGVGCRSAGKSVLSVGARLAWRWLRGPTVPLTDLGDPRSGSDYALCLYGGEGTSTIALAAIGIPADGTHWRPVGTTGWRYRTKAPGGTDTLVLRSGPTPRAKAAANLGIPDPELLLPAAALPIRVQLLNEETGRCWETVFNSGDVVANDVRRLKARRSE
jgi:uncharacterized delta-60 repeat protein